MHTHSPKLTRRGFLVGSGAAVVLAACGGDDAPDVDPTAGSTSGPGTDQNAITQQVAEAAGVTAPLDYTPLVASFEVLTGPGRRFQFGLLDESQTPLADATLTVTLVKDSDQSVVQGPLTPSYHDEGLGQRGIYVFDSEFTEPGTHYLVVATPDNAHGGVVPLTVVTPETSPIVQVGAAFPSVPTATDADPGELEALCTREPACGMHEVSLDQALADGKPIVLSIATPKYCQTAICGPVVDVVLGAKETVARDDVVFIHTEVFTDAGNTPVQLVNELQLPTEPWTFLIGADGTVVDKFDGPVSTDLLAESVTANL